MPYLVRPSFLLRRPPSSMMPFVITRSQWVNVSYNHEWIWTHLHCLFIHLVFTQLNSGRYNTADLYTHRNRTLSLIWSHLNDANPVYISVPLLHDNIMIWEHFPYHWPFVEGILWWPVDPPPTPTHTHNGSVLWSFSVSFVLSLNNLLNEQLRVSNDLGCLDAQVIWGWEWPGLTGISCWITFK